MFSVRRVTTGHDRAGLRASDQAAADCGCASHQMSCYTRRMMVRVGAQAPDRCRARVRRGVKGLFLDDSTSTAITHTGCGEESGCSIEPRLLSVESRSPDSGVSLQEPSPDQPSEGAPGAHGELGASSHGSDWPGHSSSPPQANSSRCPLSSEHSTNPAQAAPRPNRNAVRHSRAVMKWKRLNALHHTSEGPWEPGVETRRPSSDLGLHRDRPMGVPKACPSRHLGGVLDTIGATCHGLRR